MMRLLSLAAAACLMASGASAVAVGAPATADVVVADAIAPMFPWLLAPRDLHEATFRFPDGVKGASLLAPIAQRIMPDPPRDGLPADDLALWAAYCASTAIVRATNVEAVGVMTTAKDAIFTRSTYRVDDVIKGTDRVMAGGDVLTMRPGGEVVDDGERLRVVVGAADTAVVGGRYLLELRSLERQGHPDRYLVRATVADATDAPLRAEFGVRRSSYDDLARDLRRAASIAPCPQARS